MNWFNKENKIRVIPQKIKKIIIGDVGDRILEVQ